MFQQADHILIPLLDGTHALAQVQLAQGDRLRLYFTAKRAASNDTATPLADHEVFGTLVVSIDPQAPPSWPVIGYESIPRIDMETDGQPVTTLELFETHPPGIAEAFANALLGLYPWDGFPDPTFFERFFDGRDITPPPTIKMQSAFG